MPWDLVSLFTSQKTVDAGCSVHCPLLERIPFLQPRSYSHVWSESSLRKASVYPGTWLPSSPPLSFFLKNVCSIHYTSGSRCFSRGHAWPKTRVFTGENSGLPWNLASLFPSLKKTFAVSTTRADTVTSAEVIHGPKTQVFTEENSRVYPGTWLPSSLLKKHVQYPLPERIPMLQPRSYMVPRPESSLRKTPVYPGT